MTDTACVILGGGKSPGLFPLSSDTGAAATGFAGRHLMADIPLSNAVNSGLRDITLITQRPDDLLNLHIQKTYGFDRLKGGSIRTAATLGSTENGPDGTAEDLRKNWKTITRGDPERILILYSDKLFRMDLAELIKTHIQHQNDLTLSIRDLGASQAMHQPLIKTDPRGRGEKIGFPPYSDGLEPWLTPLEEKAQGFAGAVGALVVETPILEKILLGRGVHLMRSLLADSLWEYRTGTYQFKGFWQDLGSIKDWYEANLGLCNVNPGFNLYDTAMPLAAPALVLPPPKVNFATLSQVLLGEGSIISESTLTNSILGPRSVIEPGCSLDGVIMMGADRYEDGNTLALARARGLPSLGIGRGSQLSRCILDKNARIGEGCRIGVDRRERPDQDRGLWSVKDGVIIIPKDSVLAPGTVI